MIRRGGTWLGALVVPAALAVGLSSCSTVPARAATVNGTAISRSDFERDLKALAANPGLLNLTGGTDVSIDATRTGVEAQVVRSLDARGSSRREGEGL